MQPFEILLAEFEWKGCKDTRPWLVIEKTEEGHFNCFPISGQDYQSVGFRLDSTDPDFPATGLRKTCYIHDETLYSLPPSSFRDHKGSLRGALLARFLDAAGLSHLLPETNP